MSINKLQLAVVITAAIGALYLITTRPSYGDDAELHQRKFVVSKEKQFEGGVHSDSLLTSAFQPTHSRNNSSQSDLLLRSLLNGRSASFSALTTSEGEDRLVSHLGDSADCARKREMADWYRCNSVGAPVDIEGLWQIAWNGSLFASHVWMYVAGKEMEAGQYFERASQLLAKNASTGDVGSLLALAEWHETPPPGAGVDIVASVALQYAAWLSGEWGGDEFVPEFTTEKARDSMDNETCHEGVARGARLSAALGWDVKTERIGLINGVAPLACGTSRPLLLTDKYS
jgi:hypothetical protein